jgi:hypothetical protein
VELTGGTTRSAKGNSNAPLSTTPPKKNTGCAALIGSVGYACVIPCHQGWAVGRGMGLSCTATSLPSGSSLGSSRFAAAAPTRVQQQSPVRQFYLQSNCYHYRQTLRLHQGLLLPASNVGVKELPAIVSSG